VSGQYFQVILSFGFIMSVCGGLGVGGRDGQVNH